MKNKFDSKYEDIIVCIGPSIGKCCFCSSDPNFKKKFTDVWSNGKEYIVDKENGEFYIDFIYVIKEDLMNLGLKKENIVTSDICTVCNSDICFSYRINTKRKDKDYATMGAFVGLK
jgi:hypothetical protein